jgi:malate dehydrogenase
MTEVAIVGAGELGGAVAHMVARRDVASTVRLIDDDANAAAGKALDILQAAAVEGFGTKVSGTSDLTAAASADLVVIADRAGGAGEWQVADGLKLLKRLQHAGAVRIVVCAGAGQREIVERGVRELRWPRPALLGSAPEALASAVRVLVALRVDGSPSDVAMTVLGVPPARIVVPWEHGLVRGIAAARVLDAADRRAILGRLAACWPPGPYALAAAAAKVVASALGPSRQMPVCFVAPDDRSGIRERAAALPVRLGQDGLIAVELPALTAGDQVALENAVML